MLKVNPKKLPPENGRIIAPAALRDDSPAIAQFADGMEWRISSPKLTAKEVRQWGPRRKSTADLPNGTIRTERMPDGTRVEFKVRNGPESSTVSRIALLYVDGKQKNQMSMDDFDDEAAATEWYFQNIFRVGEWRAGPQRGRDGQAE